MSLHLYLATVYLLTIHFVADFLLQSDWMAQGKSKALGPLLTHVLIYASCFLLAGLGWKFALFTFWAHLLTDFVTSRINSRLWTENKVHWFFVGVGADQLAHAWQLALTFWFLR